MTRVDFYVLENDAEQAREHFTCRFVEKAWRLKHSVYLHTASSIEARRYDTLLWTWNDRSFLPHVLDAPDLDAGLAAATPVRIGTGMEPSFEAQILVNLDSRVPLFFSRFDRVAEIVGGGTVQRESARERFRFYRDRGYALETHKIGSGTQ
jgi:DNA polymerase III subunit chi